MPPTSGNAEWRRPRPTRRERRVDLVIGLAAVAGSVVMALLTRAADLFLWDVKHSLPEQLGWAVAVTAPLIWRRSHPEAVATVTAAVFIGGQIRGAQEINFASGAIFAAIYVLGAWGRDRPRARWLRIAIIGAMFVWLAAAWLLAADHVPESDRELPALLAGIVSQILINILIFGFAYLFGETAWHAAHRQHELQVQADELVEARAVAEERAVLGERMRIARDLHDIVAHHVSVMGIQAAAARRALDRDAATAATALGSVEESARTAVDELHRMLGALRTPDEPSGPAAAGVERMSDLIDRARDAGLIAELGVFGDPVGLPGSTSQTAYRIVLEAVTNVLKHAHASMVDVRLRYLARELEIDVADNGRGATATALASGGRGLAGMRERVAVHGGTVECGPRAGGGFRVRVRLPLAVAVEVGS